ncbi:cytochrome C oxidase subunit IV family protein [Parasediminibacterium sp. JCM 36343]|uniref:cytochrome C oxidase subunit IV family protein n=1 Tax=Parasediminibacterium sp. JCM 36343 TaxID=3374279 RepID=UPI00397907BB
MEYTAEVHHDDGSAVKEIWKVTGYLTILTLIELGLGFWMMSVHPETQPGLRLAIKGTIVILMMVKAFYIVGYFMHLKHELKNLIMTICVPLLLFVWFITAFLYEGNSYKNLRNNYDPYKKAQAHTPANVEKKEEGEGLKKVVE